MMDKNTGHNKTTQNRIMNTHIIIPIKDLEDRIAVAQMEMRNLNGDTSAYLATKTRQSIYQLILKDKNFKQISFDEKDIEKKAEDYYMSKKVNAFREDSFTVQKAYKQALKDLL